MLITTKSGYIRVNDEKLDTDTDILDSLPTYKREHSERFGKLNCRL